MGPYGSENFQNSTLTWDPIGVKISNMHKYVGLPYKTSRKILIIKVRF